MFENGYADHRRNNTGLVSLLGLITKPFFHEQSKKSMKTYASQILKGQKADLEDNDEEATPAC